MTAESKREELLQKRKALQQKLKIEAETDRVRYLLDALAARGADFELLTSDDPHARDHAKWFRQHFTATDSVGVPKWLAYEHHVEGPPINDQEATIAWLVALRTDEGIGSAPVVVEHGNGDPAIRLSFDELVRNFSALDEGFERWLICEPEGWVVARGSEGYWGFLRAKPSV